VKSQLSHGLYPPLSSIYFIINIQIKCYH